ncbi:MJ0307 family thioredoxin [Archaeoglobus sp.]
MMKLFTSPTCPYCPKAEKVVSKVAKDEGVVALELPVNTDEGMREALKYGIRGVPALVVDEKYLILGVPDEVELRRLIRKLKGGDVNEAS